MYYNNGHKLYPLLDLYFTAIAYMLIIAHWEKKKFSNGIFWPLTNLQKCSNSIIKLIGSQIVHIMMVLEIWVSELLEIWFSSLGYFSHFKIESWFDFDRYGLVPRSSHRQTDLILTADTVTMKMIPSLVQLNEQMSKPKYVIVQISNWDVCILKIH
jgi:hypothetical protein